MPKYKLFKLNMDVYQYVVFNINSCWLFLIKLGMILLIKLGEYYKNYKIMLLIM